MTELTPERIREAIETINLAWPDRVPGSSAENVTLGLRALEQALAAEARREKRVEELAELLCNSQPAWEFTNEWSNTGYQDLWRQFARTLLDRCPALLEESDEG